MSSKSHPWASRVLYEKRERIPGVRVEHGQNLPMRHFKSRFVSLE